MDGTRVVVVCRECKVYWDRDGQAAKCDDAGHAHQTFEVHRHRTAVVLPDGTTVTAVSFDPGGPYGREQPPDYGLYLDSRWEPPWPHDHVGWSAGRGGAFSLGVDDGLVAVGAGGLPVTGGVLAVGVGGAAVLAVGQAVPDGSVPALSGCQPIHTDLGQQVKDYLPVFPAGLWAGAGCSRPCPPLLPALIRARGRLRVGRRLTLVSVPQQVADALLGRPGQLVGLVGQAVTFPGRLVALVGAVVTFAGTVIAAAGPVIAVIAGFPPGCRVSRPQPDAPPLPFCGHPLPQQRRRLRCDGAQRVQPVPGR